MNVLGRNLVGIDCGSDGCRAPRPLGVGSRYTWGHGFYLSYYSVYTCKLSIARNAPAMDVYRGTADSLAGLFRSWEDSPMLKTSNTEGTDSRSTECSLMTLTRSPSRLCGNPADKT